MSSRRFGVRFAVGALGTWRLTHLLAEEDGPGDIILRLRARAGESLVGELLDCFNCMSIWVAGPVATLVAPRARHLPLVWLGLSGAACLLEQATAGARLEPILE
jgi:hypothetical protein